MSDTNRRQGIEFGQFEKTMTSLAYPITTDDLLAEHGDAELGVGNETTTLSAVFDPLQEDNQTYHNETELETIIMTLVGEAAIGRKNYSDRDPPALSEARAEEGAPGQDVGDEESL